LVAGALHEKLLKCFDVEADLSVWGDESEHHYLYSCYDSTETGEDVLDVVNLTFVDDFGVGEVVLFDIKRV